MPSAVALIVEVGGALRDERSEFVGDADEDRRAGRERQAVQLPAVERLLSGGDRQARLARETYPNVPRSHHRVPHAVAP
ncbi:MAG: hypothetical protein ACTHMF_12040 [Leifsonia sp.]|uniref:hypothetical protein n=1 Tax=Leifsonia sp. TaxID=1870902 RepID=UPI003F80C93B